MPVGSGAPGLEGSALYFVRGASSIEGRVFDRE